MPVDWNAPMLSEQNQSTLNKIINQFYIIESFLGQARKNTNMFKQTEGPTEDIHFKTFPKRDAAQEEAPFLCSDLTPKGEEEKEEKQEAEEEEQKGLIQKKGKLSQLIDNLFEAYLKTIVRLQIVCPDQTRMSLE